MIGKHIYLWIFLPFLALCNGVFAQENESEELVVCLMGDPQLIMVPETPRNVALAMNDLAAVEHDFMAVLGDLAQNWSIASNLATPGLVQVALAGGAILYDTSNILHHYPQDKYVAASMALFSSIAMMFWYILRLFMSRD